jgi:hypothetical protein
MPDKVKVAWDEIGLRNSTYLRLFIHIFGTGSNISNSFHTGVREASIASKL